MNGFESNIETDTVANGDFRRVLYTGKHSQLVLMSLKPGEEIGESIGFDAVDAGKLKSARYLEALGMRDIPPTRKRRGLPLRSCNHCIVQRMCFIGSQFFESCLLLRSYILSPSVTFPLSEGSSFEYVY